MISRRVLVVRTGAMGDVLHALPAVAALRRAAPETTIDWVVDPRWASLLVDGEGHSPLLRRVHLADTRLWSRAPASAATRRSVGVLRGALRAGSYALAVDVQGTLRSAVLATLSGAKQRAGFTDPRERLARLFYTQPHARRGTHVVEQNTSLFGESLGIALSPSTEAVLPRDAAAERWAADFVASHAAGRPLALLTPSAGWAAKQWPAVRFGQMAEALAEAGWCVLVNSSPVPDPAVAATLEVSRGSASAISSDIAQLIALVRRAAVVIGGDSGPVHLAAALRTPTVALFGPTDPARNGPWGPGPVRVLRNPHSSTTYKRSAAPDPGLAEIAVDTVLQAVAALTPGRL